MMRVVWNSSVARLMIAVFMPSLRKTAEVQSILEFLGVSQTTSSARPMQTFVQPHASLSPD